MFQDTIPQPSQSWIQTIIVVIASLVTGGGAFKLLDVWLNRNKPTAEIHVTEATADKIIAEARHIRVESDVQLNAIVERLHVRIDQMQLGVDEIRNERDKYKLDYDLQVIELRLAGHDIRKMRRLLEDNNISYSEADRR